MGRRLRKSTVSIGGVDRTLEISENPRARRIIVRVDPKTEWVKATVPQETYVDDARALVDREEAWLVSQFQTLPTKIAFQPGVRFPLRGARCQIVHDHDGRRGVWLEQDQRGDPHEPVCNLHVCGSAEHVPRRTQDWLKRQAKQLLADKCAVHAHMLGLAPPKITVRDTYSRWGSCSSQGSLSFSWRLIMAPDFVLDYVAAHETGHRIHMDHSRAFWHVVDGLVCHRSEAQRWLKANGAELFRYG